MNEEEIRQFMIFLHKWKKLHFASGSFGAKIMDIIIDDVSKYFFSGRASFITDVQKNGFDAQPFEVHAKPAKPTYTRDDFDV